MTMGSVIRMFDRPPHVSRRRAPQSREVVEIRYRSPAHEEISEVSCQATHRAIAHKRSRHTRRAS
jgi:hypothetical protein